MSCAWQASDVNRALHPVAKVCGPKGAGNAKQDVLFENNSCYIIQPSVVATILKVIEAVAEYPREGNLYLAEVELSSFTRPAHDQ